MGAKRQDVNKQPDPGATADVAAGRAVGIMLLGAG
jgi:hypothetical protein